MLFPTDLGPGTRGQVCVRAQAYVSILVPLTCDYKEAFAAILTLQDADQLLQGLLAVDEFAPLVLGQAVVSGTEGSEHLDRRHEVSITLQSGLLSYARTLRGFDHGDISWRPDSVAASIAPTPPIRVPNAEAGTSHPDFRDVNKHTSVNEGVRITM